MEKSSKPEGKIIEVDFKEKRALFKFGYYTNLQQALEIQKKLHDVLDDIYECTDDYEIRFKAKLLFEQLVGKLIDGKY